MKLLILITGFILSGVINPVEKKLPNVQLKTLEGETVNIQDFGENGKVTVISFWATWCSPCKRELDAIAELYPEWQEEYDMEFVAVTIDDSRGLAKVPGLVTSKGWEYTILVDNKQELKQALNFQVIPQTILVDKEGNIVYSQSGYNPGDEYELEDKIAEYAK